jgi:aryl-alcohol dehydrogenase-like predicted oxidoreductase
VRPISDLQIEYSLADRGVERDILATCRELGIGVTAYGVLSRGLISGHWTRDSGGQGDFRLAGPRFASDNLDRNLSLVDALREVADQLGITVAQTAIAWVSSRGVDVTPLVGAKTRHRLTEALGAVGVVLTDDQLAAIEAAMPAGQIAGTRYPAEHMAALDSER